MCPYSIKQDDIGFCSICMVEHKKQKEPTVCITVVSNNSIDSLSLCETHLLEIGEVFVQIKK